MLGTSFVKGDAMEMAFREGERNVVLRIMNILKIDPIKLAKKIDEAIKEEENYNN